MNLKNTKLGFLLLCCAVMTACTKDEDEKKQQNTTLGFIQAAIDTVCSGNLRIQGTHVFAYLDSSSSGGKWVYVGGFKSGDMEEIGLIIPFPVDTGDLTFFSVYYDPLNEDANPNDGSDQYGNTLSSLTQMARVDKIKYSTDSLTILEMEVRLNCCPLINSSNDTVYTDDLIIRRN